MYTLVLASQKGGSGKTTLSGHLAVQAEMSGAGPVAIIDTDPQASLAAWWNTRKSGSPHFYRAGLPGLADALVELRGKGFKLVVIDTPPAITASISQVISHADLVIVPARPSPHDLRAVGATVDIAERLGKPVIFVVNAATSRARITAEAAIALSQYGTVAPVTVKNRVDFAASMVDGRTVGEVVPDGPSASEIRDLWGYVQDRLFRLTRDPSIMPEFSPSHLSLTPLSALDENAVVETAESEIDVEAEMETEMEETDAEVKSPAPPPPNVVEQPQERRPPFEPPRASNGLSFSRVEHRRNRFGRRGSDQLQARQTK